MNLQNVAKIVIPDGEVKTIQNSNGDLLWGKVNYEVKYSGDSSQNGTPTPSVPVPVQTVTGENAVKISDGQNEQSYEIDLASKNLYDKAASSDGYRLDASGAPYADYTFTLSAYIPVQPNTTYTVSYGSTIATGYAHVASYGSDKTFVGRWYVGAVSSFTFTTQANAYYVRLAIPIDNKNTTQCELGSTATTYEAFWQIELCKIGTYQDYIYKSGEKWYVHKEIGKYVYNNDLGTNGISATRVDMLTPALPIAPNTSTQNIAISNMYGSTITNNTGLGGTTASSLIRVMTSASIAGSYDAVRALAAANNLTIYYALAAPTDTEITNQALITQLEAVDQWMTRYGYNASVTGNLPIIIDKTAL